MKAGALKDEAKSLRRKGYSFREISEKLGISESTASLWLKGVGLSKSALKRIENLGMKGRKRGCETIRHRMAEEDGTILESVKKTIKKSKLLKNDLKIACALLYWCEGGKTEKSQLTFINSDPILVKYFINAFREAFGVDESRFRVLIHVHNYHNIEKQIVFWSEVTGISRTQFIKPYNKPNTGKRVKDDYQGCVSIRYYGRKIRQEMMFLIEEISK